MGQGELRDSGSRLKALSSRAISRVELATRLETSFLNRSTCLEEPAMSNNIPILLQRNLDVFAENDPTRRRALIDQFYTEDCVFYDPNSGVHRGRDEIDRIAEVIKATHPDFQY
jgi:hypothetical protein